jgi:hypothetical protein
MLVARATSTGSGSRPKTKSRRCFARATSSVETRDVISIGSLMMRSARCASLAAHAGLSRTKCGIAPLAMERRGSASIRRTARLCHVRVSGILARLRRCSLRIEFRFRGCQQGRQGAQEHELGTTTLGGDAEIEPRRFLRGRYRARKETVCPVNPGRWEDAGARPVKKRGDLITCPPYRCR